jgi:hypothetical protein
MVTFTLYTSWVGYERGYGEINPILWKIVCAIRDYTGSWAWGILPFIPIVIIGIYVAAWFLDRDLEKSGYRGSFRAVFAGLILINLTSSLHQARIIRLPSDPVPLFILSYAPPLIYIVYEIIRWRTSCLKSAD